MYLECCDNSIKDGYKPFKALAVALFAGCLTLGGCGTSYAADDNLSVMPVSYDNGKMVLTKSNAATENGYTLTEVVPSDISNLPPNVIEYYDPNNLDDKVHYYEVGLKYSEYGEGDVVKYYKWAKDQYGVKLVETDTPSEAVFTLKSDGTEKLDTIFVASGNTLSYDVNELYVLKDIKDAIDAKGTIENISTQFLGNTLKIDDGDGITYTAILSETTGKITNINSLFAGNEITVNSSRTIYGALIKSIGEIDNITSNFIGNRVTTVSDVTGALIEVSGTGTIGNIVSDFINNSVVASNSNVEGSVLANEGQIGAISSSKFIGNYGVSDGGDVLGGVIANKDTIKSVDNSVFISNSVKSTSGTARGGAIYNSLLFENGISNSIFKDNYAEGKTAQGGAIYTDTHLTINATDGKLTEFTGNYVINDGVKSDNAIYVGDRSQILTLSAYDGGRILMNDSINGVNGYQVSLTGNDKGTISLYNNIYKANVSASGVNIDTADGKYYDYNFLSLEADESAKFSIDLSFKDGKADTFTVGEDSIGRFLISNLNIQETELPTTNKVIQILKGADTIRLVLAQDLIDKYHFDGEINRTETDDIVAATTKWDKKYYSHTVVDTLSKGIRAVTSSGNKMLADSIEYYYDLTSEELAPVSMGDTLKLVNQLENNNNRIFQANSADDIYTLTDNLGQTAPTQNGTSYWMSVFGYKNGDVLSTIDAGEYTMFEMIDKASNVRLQNVLIRSNNAVDGAIINAQNSDSHIRIQEAVNIEGVEGSNGIISNGSLEFLNGISTSNTGITGDGNMSISNATLNLTDGASIKQGTLELKNNGNLNLDDNAFIDAAVTVGYGRLTMSANGILQDVIQNVNGSSISLTGGNLVHDITRTAGNGSVSILGETIISEIARVSSTMYVKPGGSIMANANSIGGSVTLQGDANGTAAVTLTGGELGYQVIGNGLDRNSINVTDDLHVLDTGSLGTVLLTVNEGKTLSFEKGAGLTATTTQNRGVLEFKSGSIGGTYIRGDGHIEIAGNVYNYNNNIYQKIHVQDGKNFTTQLDRMGAGTTIVNDGIFSILGGTLNRIITSTAEQEAKQAAEEAGETYVVSPDNTGEVHMKGAAVGTEAHINTKINQKIFVDKGVLRFGNSNYVGNVVDTTSEGILELQGSGTLKYDVTGEGTLRLWGAVVNNEADIYTKLALGRQNSYGTFTTNADKLHNTVNLQTGTLNLTGGTLNYDVSSTSSVANKGTVNVTKGDVVSNALIQATNVSVKAGASLKTDADNLVVSNSINNAGILELTGGKIDQTIDNVSGQLIISGNVGTTDDRRIQNEVIVNENGNFRVKAANLQNTKTHLITNNGELYLSGAVTKNIAGSGTTYIDESISLTTAAAVDGSLNLNNGYLSLASVLGSNYDLGTAVGEGNLSFHANLTDKVVDTLTLNSDSSGKFYIDGVWLSGVQANMQDVLLTVLKGGSNAQLALKNGELKTFSHSDYNEWTDSLKADVYNDDTYNYYRQYWYVNGTIALATKDYLNDSILINTEGMQDGKISTTEGDILAGLNRFVTDEDRHFRFRSADTVYKQQESLGQTAVGDITIHGEYDEGTDTRSTIDMTRVTEDKETGKVSSVQLSGFNLVKDAVLNISNTKFINSFNVINSNNGHIGYIDENGHVSEGITNSVFSNNYVNSNDSTSNSGGIVMSLNGATVVSQIINSTISDNYINRINSSVYTTPSSNGILYLTNNTQIGSKDTLEGGIINTVFENNYSKSDYGNRITSFGTVITMSNNSFISQIKDTTFKNNYAKDFRYYNNGNVYTSIQGNALALRDFANIGAKFTDEDGTVRHEGGILNTIFDGNYITETTYVANDNQSAIGAALYLSGANNYIANIKDSTFKNNYIENFNGNHGSAIYNAGIIHNIENTIFENNSVSTAYGAMSGGAIYSSGTIDIIKDCTFNNNKALYTVTQNANSYGGAISGNVALIDHSVFRGNQAFYGGVISTGRAMTITNDTLFENNVGIYQAGALRLTGTKNISSNISNTIFRGNGVENENAADSMGGAIYNEQNLTMDNVVFDGNYNTQSANRANYGGAIYTYGNLNISNSEFKNNILKNTANNLAYGGAIYNIYRDANKTGQMSFTKVKFINNSATTKQYHVMGGAIFSYDTNNRAVIDSIADCLFSGNYVSVDWNNGGILAQGGAIYNISAKLDEISNTTFEKNYVYAPRSSGGGGALYNAAENTILGVITGSTFTGNHVFAGGNFGRGGAAFINGNVQEGVVNSSFTNNYVETTKDIDNNNDNFGGGAIFAWKNLAIVADNGLTKFSDNYIAKVVKKTLEDGSVVNEIVNKLDQGIYVYSEDKNRRTLTLKAINNGQLLMKDSIGGSKNLYTVKLTGDETGTISLYNNIYGGTVNAEKTNIDTADGNLYDYDFYKLNSYDTAKYKIDIDFLNKEADTFTLGVDSTGKVFISNMNILNNAQEITKVQVLKAVDDSIQLALDEDKYHIVQDVVLDVQSVMKDTDVFHQEAGFATSDTDTKNDSITMFVDKTYDNLSLIASSELNQDRRFEFETENVYNVNEDLRTVSEGVLTIQGLESGSTINANNHSMFELANKTQLNIINTTIQGADDIIKVTNAEAAISLQNSNIDGNIIGTEHFAMDVNGTSSISGVVTNADTTVQSGEFKFGENTFADTNDKLIIEGGHIKLDNGEIENYTINNLVTNKNSDYSIDVDLTNSDADKIEITGAESKGVITISNINYQNNPNEKDFTVQILNTDGKVSLAMDENINNYVIENISRNEQDRIKVTTKFSDHYWNYTRNGVLAENVYLATTNSDNDSLRFVIEEVWEKSRTQGDTMGDTLKLVNQYNTDHRFFEADQANQAYLVKEDLGKTAVGEMIINGIHSNDDELSTINMNGHSGFNIGDDTILTINNTRLTGSEDLIIAEGSAVINLSNAFIDGNIKAAGNNINISGQNTTTIVGTVENAVTSLNKGTLEFSENTFASSDDILKINDASVAFANDELEEYNINTLISSDKSKYSIDIDLTAQASDTITVGANSSGIIMLDNLHFSGDLSKVTLQDEYNIRILHAQNNNIELALSESATSATSDPVFLGKQQKITDIPVVDPVSYWDDQYYLTVQDLSVYGLLKLATSEGGTVNDSLHLDHLSIVEGVKYEILGDTLKLLNQLETNQDRQFIDNNAEHKFLLTEDLGTTTAGKFDIIGAVDENNKTSTIDMNNKAGFGLSNETELTFENLSFENIAYQDGSLAAISNEKAVLNLDNVSILNTQSVNAIINDGTVNMTGGDVILNTGITGGGVTNVINGANVVFGDEISLTQKEVNVTNGSLRLADNGVINGVLNIGALGNATLHTSGLKNAVSNAGNINLTGGELTQNITGGGVTNIIGNVTASANIVQNVDIQSGALTASTTQLGGNVNNSAELNLTGDLSKVITGEDGTTTVNESLKLSQGAGVEGTLNLNNAAISTKDDKFTNYEIGTMSGVGKFTIDVDFKTPQSDTFTVGDQSSGTVYIDSINFINMEGITNSLTIKVLETNGTDALQLALNEELSNKEYKIGRTSRNEQDDVLALTNYKKDYRTYVRGGDVFGTLDVGTSEGGTLNDSLTITAKDPVWDKEREDTGSLGDTLVLWTQLQTDENKVFDFLGNVDIYNVRDNVEGLGVANGANLTINGTSTSETIKSTINLNGKTGFELANASVLNINNTKLTGNDTLISVSNKDAVINLNNSYINGNIAGSEQYAVNIDGDDVTTINGNLVNSNTTFKNGILKFNENTFADKKDSLTAENGKISMDNGNLEKYIINKFESSSNVKYSIDINFADKTSDVIQTSIGNGVVTLDSLNILATAADINKDYKVQILKVESGDLQLALSDNLQAELGKESYLIGTTTAIIDDEIKADTNWKETYDRYTQDTNTYGKLTLVDSQTTNDSIGIKVSDVVVEDKKFKENLGDTLMLVSNAENETNKTFNFDTSSDVYKTGCDIGKVNGTLAIKGVQKDGNYSAIDFNSNSGFELSENSNLVISNTILKNARNLISNIDGSVKLTNVGIIDNFSSEDGHVISSNSDIEIAADNGNSVISGNNNSTEDEAIYMSKDSALTLNSINKGEIILNDKINGEDLYIVKITGDKSGGIYLNNKINNAEVQMDTTTLHLSSGNNLETSNVTINSGRLDLVNNKAQQQLASSFNVNGSFTMDVDVDLANLLMDRLPENTSLINPDAVINVDRINLISDTSSQIVEIPFAYNQFKDNVKYIGAAELSKATQVTTAYSPIYKYSIGYENRADLGYFVFTKGAGAPSNSYGAYNPSVLASPISAQAGAYSAMNQSLNYVFEHSDTYMMLPLSQRLTMRDSNKYAINSPEEALAYRNTEFNNNAMWNQSYATFEHMGLKNGPGVDITSYGTMLGGDSELKELSGGWQTVTTAYAGYNGANISYSGVSIMQNGGVLGATQTFYKKNFFTAITASAGASVGDASTMYGHEDFTSLMAGVASKSGYNIELKEGKFIVQPSMLMAYTFVNTFDYTNAAGVRIESDPLHTIQLHPDVKFIANLAHGWQPYARIGMVWNILNDTKVSANNVQLPEMSIKPYVEYGVGIQKHWTDKFSAYLQAMIRNGGRNGVLLTGGFRWLIGKDTAEKVQNNNIVPVSSKVNERKVIKRLK